MPIAIVDAGPLFATLDADDEVHDQSRLVLRRTDLQLVIPALVLGEVAYLAGRRLGARVEAGFVRAMADFEIEVPTPMDCSRIAQLVEQYADWPLGSTDASVVALAERLGTDLVITLDRRHFAAIRPRHCAAFQILPG